MPILTPTRLTGTITWLGLVADRRATLCADPVDRVEAVWEGLAGECHGGLTRRSCSRVVAQYPKGTEIRNTRQISILSEEELAAIAAAMDLPTLDPAWLGGNIVLRGIPDLTLLPPGSRLIAPSGAALVVDMENGPCQFPAREIEARHPGHGKRFIPAARGRRGVTGWVERPGTMARGDALALHVPPQRLYPHLGRG